MHVALICVISKCLHFATFTKKLLAKLMCDFVLHSVNVTSLLLLSQDSVALGGN